jgi:hypothetical protein
MNLISKRLSSLWPWMLLSLWLVIYSVSPLQAEDRILTNHLGYERSGPKHAVVMGKQGETISACALHESTSNRPVREVSAKAAGPVNKWRDWYFWTLDFDDTTGEGQYYLQCTGSAGDIRSSEFAIGPDLVLRQTLPNVLYYFKAERSSGALDQADRHLSFQPPKKGTVDVHGGWYDASGDYGKHLSHLSFSTYFNPQQIPLAVYTLFKSYGELERRGQQGFTKFKPRLMERILDEATFGADYLVRVKDPAGSFYRSVGSGDGVQNPQDRHIDREARSFAIFQSENGRPGTATEATPADEIRQYEVSYRSGGGIAIAALAMAAKSPVAGEYSNSDYLKAAEAAFDFLEKNNASLLNDGKENIVDDYCALAAAVELYKATGKERYKAAADRRAQNLLRRLTREGKYQNYWRADDGTRPFFHASDAGFPIVSLLYYAEIASDDVRGQVLDVVKKSLQFELEITGEVTNPFGYSREFIQDKTGARRTVFFFPHNSDAAPWWQGEDARLASLAAAARLALPHFRQDAQFAAKLQTFATNQINWILGLNPFDVSLMMGVGRNTPPYMFFDTWEMTSTPGGISNGITSGFHNEEDIDFNLSYKQTGADNDWRWSEQWLPHAAWYLLAVAAGGS